MQKTATNRVILACFRWSVESPESIQFEAAAEEETEIPDGVHEPPNIRVGEAIPLPEVFITSR